MQGEKKEITVDTIPLNSNMTTNDVIDALHASGKPLHEWGQAIDGMPMLAARTGGDKQPAIFITAGSHAIEPAGVYAALNLLQMLDTEHEVHILPLRDPFGFAGVNHCLSFAAGHSVEVSSQQATLDFLKTRAQLLWREKDMHLFKLSDVGFVWNAPRPGLGSYREMQIRMAALTRDDPDALLPLRGKSVMLIDEMVDVEGSSGLQRCFHIVMGPAGEWLHLNRFFGSDDAPPEVAAVDRLMQTVRPGLTCDLHEGNEDGFWMPLHMPEKIPAQVVVDMARAYFDYIHACGYPITTYKDWLAKQQHAFPKGYPPGRNRPEPGVPEAFWSNVLQTGEGHNLGSYASLFGVGFDTEAPIKRSLAMRVNGVTNGILAAIKAWEETV